MFSSMRAPRLLVTSLSLLARGLAEQLRGYASGGVVRRVAKRTRPNSRGSLGITHTFINQQLKGKDMDTSDIGGIIGCVLGICGGVIGTCFSIRNTSSP